MIITVNNDFTKLNVTSGTVQNTDNYLVAEISRSPKENSGVLLYPQAMFQLSGSTVYARAVGKSPIDLRVVPFYVDVTGSSGGTSSSETIHSSETVTADIPTASDDDIDNLLDDVFGND